MLSHGSVAVRSSAARFAAAAARQLSKAEAFVFLQPKVFPALTRNPTNMQSPESLASCLPPHTAKAVSPEKKPANLPKSRWSPSLCLAGFQMPLLIDPALGRAHKTPKYSHQNRPDIVNLLCSNSYVHSRNNLVKFGSHQRSSPNRMLTNDQGWSNKQILDVQT